LAAEHPFRTDCRARSLLRIASGGEHGKEEITDIQGSLGGNDSVRSRR
jgi:hypothetical protein